ncbi:MAG: nucleotide exchange factor GrpE [Methylococcales bacterium]|nr:nucleotide exchange factor GrpE [Methylococcales bacterium]
MSHQQSSHEQTPESEMLADELEQMETERQTQAATESVAENRADTVESLQQALAEARQQAAANLDRAIRVQAEMENLKKRVQKDLDDERKYGLTKIARELLSVVDSLELGLRAATGDSPEVVRLREGSELTIKQFEAVFSKFNIEAIDPTGQPFNPELHQAMAMQPSATVEPGMVITSYQKGYILNGRLLRPAMVVVAKAEDKSADAPKNNDQA